MQSQGDRLHNAEDLVEVSNFTELDAPGSFIRFALLIPMRTVQGLVREYLTRNSLAGTLKAFDCEKVSTHLSRRVPAVTASVEMPSLACSQELQAR